ncbi:MAG: hypothetical protein GY943_38010, partial [Chloroflexi bacterium]|nr:hypothetical protein [Chloroflexota bacterium]
YTGVVGTQTAVSIPPIPDHCETLDTLHEPPCNPSLAQSAWAVTHRGSYAQGSSALPGPDVNQSYLAQHIDLGGIPVTFNFTAPYPDGGIVAWTTAVGASGTIAKIDHDAFAIIDLYKPQDREADAPDTSLNISGAYSVLDRDNHFIVGRQRSIELFTDSVNGDSCTPIMKVKRFQLADTFFCGDEDILVGLNLTYDDHIVVVSER